MKTKSFLYMLLLAVTMTANFPQVWAMDVTGTADDPYLIYNAADMREFADVVGGRNGKKRNQKACAKLMADIPDLGEWTPIGNSDGHYKGKFDGQYHTISGMTITNYKKVNQGLFGYTEDADIYHFQLYGTMTSSANICGGDNDCSGTVVGYAIKNTRVIDVVSYVNMTITGKQKHLGGIVGQMSDNGYIYRCEYRGTIDAGPSTDCIGGIVGFIHAESTVDIEGCISRGHLVSTGELPVMGGILGYVNVLLDEKTGYPEV